MLGFFQLELIEELELVQSLKGLGKESPAGSFGTSEGAGISRETGAAKVIKLPLVGILRRTPQTPRVCLQLAPRKMASYPLDISFFMPLALTGRI